MLYQINRKVDENKTMKICVYGAASSKIDKQFIEVGEELGRKMVERGHTLVFGGGKGGMMGAVARGIIEKKGQLLGIQPKFFEENNAEIAFAECTEFIHTETMRERKKMLDEMSDAFIVTPGGIGTFDEFFEILTLKQLGRHPKAIVIFNVNGYYDHLLKMMEHSVEKHFITEETADLYKVTTTIDETLDYLESYDPSSIDLSKVKIN